MVSLVFYKEFILKLNLSLLDLALNLSQQGICSKGKSKYNKYLHSTNRTLIPKA